MADAGCSGTRPFKTLVNHHDHDRSLTSSLATKPSLAPNTFRGSSTNGPDHGRFKSFMGGDHPSPTPIPTLAATPITAGNVTGAIPSTHPSFPAPQHPYYRQNDDQVRKQGWAQEYLRQSSISATSQNDHTSYKPNLAPTNNRPIQSLSPGLVNGAYNGSQLPSVGQGFPVWRQPAGASERAAEVTEWMGAHRPSGVALEDVDQVLNQISGELEELVVEPVPERELQSATVQGEGASSQGHAESQPSETAELETSRSGTDRPTAVSHLARKILQAVDHEDDEKWKDSSFLELMRDFRDGRKDVAENAIEIVTT